MPTCEDYGLSPEECAALTPEEKITLDITTEEKKAPPRQDMPLNAFQGRFLYDTTTGQGGILRAGRRATKGKRGGELYYVLRDPDTNRVVAQVSAGGTLLDPDSRRLISIAGFNNIRESTATNEDINRLFGGGLGGSTRTAAEEELTRAQTADIAVQQQLARERIAEDKRQNLLNTARALVEQQMQAKSQAQTQGVQLAGYDPFRFIGQLRGQDVAAGVATPFDIFKGYLQGQATQQSPNIGPNSTIADLESALGKLPQAGQQPTAPSFGFEKGGSTGTMGPYEVHLVGEAGSQIAPGTEVMITGASIVPNPGETTILPLGGGMEEGGVLKPGSLGTLPTQFQNLRSRLGGRLGYLPAGTQKEPQFGGGYGAMTTPLSQNLRRGYGELVGLGKISQQDADFVTNAIGELPTPRAANQWFKTLSPTELEAVLSLYKLAGISQPEFDEMLKSALVVGGPRQAVRIAA